MTYEQRLRQLELPSLKYRRLRGDMIQVYKIVKGIDDVQLENFFEINSFDKTRNTGDKFYIQFARNNSRKNCFSMRTAPIWNTKLTPLTKKSKDLNSFKEQLDREPYFTERKYSHD